MKWWWLVLLVVVGCSVKPMRPLEWDYSIVTSHPIEQTTYTLPDPRCEYDGRWSTCAGMGGPEYRKDCQMVVHFRCPID